MKTLSEFTSVVLISMIVFSCEPDKNITIINYCEHDTTKYQDTTCNLRAKGIVARYDYCNPSKVQESIIYIQVTDRDNKKDSFVSFASPISPIEILEELQPLNLPEKFSTLGLRILFDYKIVDTEYLCNGDTLKEIIICDIELDTTASILPLPCDPCIIALKPVIYLYPEVETEVKVQLDYKGKLFVTYPDYNIDEKGWNVTASPNGTIINHEDKMEYQYLFWEGESYSNEQQYDLSEGFIVKGSETKAFLQKTLSQLGLIPREYNEMIVFWLPKLMNNPYNLIHFAEESYTKTAPLTITPIPDNIIRVFMVMKPLTESINIKEQIFSPYSRNGFTVIEWGGTILPTDQKDI